MKPLSRTNFYWVAAALTSVMLATRVGHIGDWVHLPDASMAVFFLGGLYLRRYIAFACYMLLAIVIDWAVITYGGVSSFCVTWAYAFLVPAYAALWYGGRLYASKLDGTALSFVGAFGVALVSASISFAISNGSFYWLGGRHPNPDVAGWLAGAWRWGPQFVEVTLGYVAAALAAHAIIRMSARQFVRDEQVART